MKPIYFAFVALGLFLGIHFVLWCIRLPKSQLRTLLVLSFLTWCGAVLIAGIGGWRLYEFAGAQAPIGFLYFCLFYWAAALCYVITYSAMEGDSPTLSLTRHLHAKGEKGLTQKEIEQFFRQRPFVGARIKALIRENILIEEQGGYRLASGKYFFFRTILEYRRIVFGSVKSGG